MNLIKIILSAVFLVSLGQMSFGAECFVSKNQVKNESDVIEHQGFILCFDLFTNGHSDLSVRDVHTLQETNHLKSLNGRILGFQTMGFSLDHRKVVIQLFSEPDSDGNLGVVAIRDSGLKSQISYFLTSELTSTDL
jgi:hypothetical protein